MLHCPQCGSTLLYKDGYRYLADGSSVQRYLCRNCSYRFSETRKQYINTYTKSEGDAHQKAAKLLVEDQRQTEKQEAGATENSYISNPTLDAKILEHAWWLKKQGYSESTITGRVKLLKTLVKRGANLYDPESVKEVIAKQENWSEGRKELAVEAYSSYLLMVNGKWSPPKYKRVGKLPFIPTEQELDTLINGCGPKTSAFLQLLKETGMRAGEAWNLKWTDIDFVNNTIRVTPEKGSNPRIFKVSGKLLCMLNSLPKKSQKVFGGYPIQGFARCFQRKRKVLAQRHGNPRLLQITFHTFRHWKATMEYYKTKDILYVMRLLGHKNIKNTLIYTQLTNFGNEDEYVCKVATSNEEIMELIEAGFEYVCDHNGAKFFRKRK